MPLCYAPIGEESVIRRVGGKPEMRRHLENLGFVAGGRVTVLSSTDSGLIASVKGVRVAVSRELAQKIMI